MKREFYVYILKCSDGTYYTGITNNIDGRFDSHKRGLNKKCYTYNRRPLKLLYFEVFKYVNNAILREKQIKGWSRAKKQALIKLDYDKLYELSKRYKINF